MLDSTAIRHTANIVVHFFWKCKKDCFFIRSEVQVLEIRSFLANLDKNNFLKVTFCAAEQNSLKRHKISRVRLHWGGGLGISHMETFLEMANGNFSRRQAGNLLFHCRVKFDFFFLFSLTGSISSFGQQKAR